MLMLIYFQELNIKLKNLKSNLSDFRNEFPHCIILYYGALHFSTAWWTGVYKEGIHDRSIKSWPGSIRRGSMIGQSSLGQGL